MGPCDDWAEPVCRVPSRHLVIVGAQSAHTHPSRILTVPTLQGHSKDQRVSGNVWIFCQVSIQAVLSFFLLCFHLPDHYVPNWLTRLVCVSLSTQATWMRKQFVLVSLIPLTLRSVLPLCSRLLEVMLADSSGACCPSRCVLEPLQP